MKILFMGTPEFSVESLKVMVQNSYEILGVITQSDKPKGRGYKLEPTPVKKYALEHNIPVYQPTILKDRAIENLLNKLAPDLIIVTAYGKILPKYILDFPKFGAINIHASLLPNLRGAAPIQWSIINSYSTTGITSMYMAEKLDAGDMLLQSECTITNEDTAGSLHDKLCKLSGEVLLKTLKAVEDNSLSPIKQNEKNVCYAPLLTNQNTKIDFNLTAKEVYNFIRGLCPFPAAKTSLNNVNFKISSSKVSDVILNKENGTITVSKSNVFVSCGENTTLEILELTAMGSKKMRAFDYFNGHKTNEMDKFQ